MKRLRLIWNILQGKPVMSRMHVTPFAILEGSDGAFVVDNLIDYGSDLVPFTAEEARSGDIHEAVRVH